MYLVKFEYSVRIEGTFGDFFEEYEDAIIVEEGLKKRIAELREEYRNFRLIDVEIIK